MSFGLGISFGRLCRLEELRAELEPKLHEWDADWLYEEHDGGISFVLKATLPMFKVDDGNRTS